MLENRGFGEGWPAGMVVWGAKEPVRVGKEAVSYRL